MYIHEPLARNLSLLRRVHTRATREGIMANKSGTRKQAKRVKPAIGWTIFGIAVAFALALAITMCVIGLR